MDCKTVCVTDIRWECQPLRQFTTFPVKVWSPTEPWISLPGRHFIVLDLWSTSCSCSCLMLSSSCKRDWLFNCCQAVPDNDSKVAFLLTPSTAVARRRGRSTAIDSGRRCQKSSIARCSNVVDGVLPPSTAIFCCRRRQWECYLSGTDCVQCLDLVRCYDKCITM